MLKLEFFLFCLKHFMVISFCAYNWQERQKFAYKAEIVELILRKYGPTSSGTANRPEFTISFNR